MASADIRDSDTAGTGTVGTITLTDARVALKDIELEEEDGDDGDDATEFDFGGPFIVDLLADTVTPPLTEADVPAGNYNEVKLKLDKIEGDEDHEDGAPLLAASFRLATWFDFSNVVLTGTDIVLDDTSTGVNDKLRDIIKENIKESADHGEDSDGDGELDSDEDDAEDDGDEGRLKPSGLSAPRRRADAPTASG